MSSVFICYHVLKLVGGGSSINGDLPRLVYIDLAPPGRHTIGSFPEDYMPTLFDNYASNIVVNGQVPAVYSAEKSRSQYLVGFPVLAALPSYSRQTA